MQISLLTEMMMNPTDANAPLTEDQRKTYMACKARKVYNLSTGQMVFHQITHKFVSRNASRC